MTDEQWKLLTAIIRGENDSAATAGFIIDSPWLPGWAGIHTLDYYTSDMHWFHANRLAIETFPDVLFLPGFWSEYGMCTEPSAFGARPVWFLDDLPHADKVISHPQQIPDLIEPDCRKDGLLPFVINRLTLNESRMADMGHKNRFAIARGPLNVASFLMGTTEFLTLLALDPEKTNILLRKISDFSVDWLCYQKECFPSIDGILILDDIVGFIGESHFRMFAMPYLKQMFSAFDCSIRFFHNDADGRICAPFLNQIGVNLFNFSHEHALCDMQQWVGTKVALLGNIPPRDVLANGTPQDIHKSVRQAAKGLTDHNRLVWSCGGGMPPGVTSENIQAFLRAIQSEHLFGDRPIDKQEESL